MKKQSDPLPQRARNFFLIQIAESKVSSKDDVKNAEEFQTKAVAHKTTVKLLKKEVSLDHFSIKFDREKIERGSKFKEGGFGLLALNFVRSS